MNRSTSLIFGLVGIYLGTIGCHKEIDNCGCKDNEICFQSECYLKESVHEIGGTTVITPNSYVGIVQGNYCVDTLIFYNDTTRAIDDERFGLIVNGPFGVENVMGSEVPYQASGNEYYAQTVDELCHLNGNAWYANLHYFIYPDSVWMKLKFWPLDGSQGFFIDSCIVTFYKTP